MFLFHRLTYDRQKDLVENITINKTTVSWIKMEKEGRKENKHETKKRWLKFSHRAVFVFVLFILILVLLMQIWKCLKHYYEAPTYFETRITPQHKALFPAMTICPQNNGYNENKLRVTFKDLKLQFSIQKIYKTHYTIWIWGVYTVV